MTRRCAALRIYVNVCNLFGYGEIKPDGSVCLRELDDDRVSQACSAEFFCYPDRDAKKDVYPSFRAFLSKDRASRRNRLFCPYSHQVLRRSAVPASPSEPVNESGLWKRDKMSSLYTIEDLEGWDEKIREKAREFGLDCYPQQFEICDHNQMLSSMAYSGVPSHYPHWSYGKTYEKQKTLYDYGVSGLPYELVINSNPVLAYLMRDNTLLLQILTIAHVYGHNDFFKNNSTFKTTRPEYTIDTFKAHGDRVRSYIENPGIGLEKVETLLDAAHAVALQCRSNLAIRKRTPEEEREVLMQSAQPLLDPFQRIHRRMPPTQPDLNKVPPVPDQDLLLFIRDHNPNLAGWERDVLTIVHEEAQYFIPQIETKLMNEGWATYWHKRILDSLNLPQDLHLEFIVRHNQVVRPHSFKPQSLSYRSCRLAGYLSPQQ